MGEVRLLCAEMASSAVGWRIGIKGVGSSFHATLRRQSAGSRQRFAAILVDERRMSQAYSSNEYACATVSLAQSRN